MASILQQTPRLTQTLEQRSKSGKIYAIRPNKSALKRDHAKFIELTNKLVEKPPQILNKLPLNQDILRQIEIAQNIKGGAFRRQIKHIANQLFQLDEETINDLQKDEHHPESVTTRKNNQIEQIALTLLDQTDGYLEATLEKFPQLERQKLRTFILQINREKQKQLPAKAIKKLNRYLYEQIH